MLLMLRAEEKGREKEIKEKIVSEYEINRSRAIY